MGSPNLHIINYIVQIMYATGKLPRCFAHAQFSAVPTISTQLRTLFHILYLRIESSHPMSTRSAGSNSHLVLPNSMEVAGVLEAVVMANATSKSLEIVAPFRRQKVAWI